VRVADRCLITGQPLYCPDCREPLSEGLYSQGYCCNEECWRYDTLAFPVYGSDEPPYWWAFIPEARQWAEPVDQEVLDEWERAQAWAE
jgi:hypothetical protein